jgi:uncharacterized protein YodC (DUF2158 family)
MSINDQPPQPSAFVPGASVRLKSGGPEMRVVVTVGGWVCCAWVDADGVQEAHTFDGDALQPVDAGEAMERRESGEPAWGEEREGDGEEQP